MVKEMMLSYIFPLFINIKECIGFFIFVTQVVEWMKHLVFTKLFRVYIAPFTSLSAKRNCRMYGLCWAWSRDWKPITTLCLCHTPFFSNAKTFILLLIFWQNGEISIRRKQYYAGANEKFPLLHHKWCNPSLKLISIHSDLLQLISARILSS